MMTHQLLASVVEVSAPQASSVPTGANFKDWVLVIAGNIFIAILVLRAIGHYFKREWGELFGHIAAGVLVGGLIYANNQTINVLKGFWGLLSGGN